MIEGFDYRKLAATMEQQGVLDVPFRDMTEAQVDAVIESVRRCLPPALMGLDDVPF
jgi:hypothetical protein